MKKGIIAAAETVFILFAMLFGLFPAPARAADLPGGFVRTDGRVFRTEDGEEYFIRGIAFENDVFSDSTEPPAGYSDADTYRELAELGFNTVRFYLNYIVFEDDTAPYEYKDAGFAWLEENIVWAKEAGIRLILNMHFPQGGYQSLGEGDALWKEQENQNRFTALWKEIALRYADEPAILGYGLVNEPRPVGETDAHDGLRVWQELAQTTVDAIRSVDQSHVIFIEKAEGTKDPATGDMLWEFKSNEQYVAIQDDNYAYEFHCYEPSEFTHQGFAWAGTEDTYSEYPNGDSIIASGLSWVNAQYGNGADIESREWQHVETSIAKIPKNINVMGISLHVSNLGTGGVCYADNLIVEEYDKQGNLVRSISAEDKDTAGKFDFWSDDGTGSGDISSKIGIDDSRSVVIQGVVGSANMNCVCVRPVTGHSYKATADILVENAEDEAYISTSLEMYEAQSVSGGDRVALENAIVKNLDVSVKTEVPLYCGEFGAGIHCFEDNGGQVWVSDMIDLLTQYGVGFSYHNYRSNSFGLRYVPEGAVHERRNEALAQVFGEKLGGTYVPEEAPEEPAPVEETPAEPEIEEPVPEEAAEPAEPDAPDEPEPVEQQAEPAAAPENANVKLGKNGCGSVIGDGWCIVFCLIGASLLCTRKKR